MRTRGWARAGTCPFAIGAGMGMLIAGLVVPLAVEGSNSSAVQTRDRVPANGGSVAASDVDAGEGAAAGNDQAGPIRPDTAPPSSRVRPSGVTSQQAVSTANVRGVTAGTITIGALLVDVGGGGRVGFSFPGIDPEQQKANYELYIGTVNKAGGINGRKLRAVYRTFDVLSQDDERAACLALTEDNEVFAIFGAGGYYGPPVLCITEEHATLLLALGVTGTPSEYYRRSGDRLFTVYPGSGRQMLNWVAELQDVGTLRDKRIGILGDEGIDPNGTVGSELEQALQRFGYQVAHRSRLSADFSTAASQIPLEISRMRSAGVGAVMILSHVLNTTQFVQASTSQGWRPQWLVSDFANQVSDEASQNMGDGYDGALAIGTGQSGAWRIPEPEPAADAACRQQYEETTGSKLPRNNGNEANSEYGLAVSACGFVKLFVQAATAAGIQLTPTGFSSALRSLGNIEMPTVLGGAFGPEKFDLNDRLRTFRFFADCTCWKPIDAIRQARF